MYGYLSDHNFNEQSRFLPLPIENNQVNDNIVRNADQHMNVQ